MIAKMSGVCISNVEIQAAHRHLAFTDSICCYSDGFSNLTLISRWLVVEAPRFHALAPQVDAYQHYPENGKNHVGTSVHYPRFHRLVGCFIFWCLTGQIWWCIAGSPQHQVRLWIKSVSSGNLNISLVNYTERKILFVNWHNCSS
jgi:hypothetical protein